MVPSFCRFLLENLLNGAPNRSRGWKMFLKKISGGGGRRRDAYSGPKSRVADPVLLLLLVLL